VTWPTAFDEPITATVGRSIAAATSERSELGGAPSYAKDVTRGERVVAGRVARPLRRAGVIEVSAAGANTARVVERME